MNASLLFVGDTDPCLHIEDHAINGEILAEFRVPQTFLDGLRYCNWPGRSQVLHRAPITYFLDGAHTPKSLHVSNHLFLHISTCF